MELPAINIEKDEFERYAYNDPTLINNPKTFNPIT